MKNWGNCWWVGNSTATQTCSVGSEQKILLCLRDVTHSPIKRHVPGSKDSTKSLPKLHSLNYPLLFSSSFCLFQWASWVNPSCIHSPDTDLLTASSLADLTGKWSFGLGSDAAVIRAMEIPLVKINSIAPAFSILGYWSHHIQSFSLFLPSLSPYKKEMGSQPS